jgi:hypothetical protein
MARTTTARKATTPPAEAPAAAPAKQAEPPAALLRTRLKESKAATAKEATALPVSPTRGLDLAALAAGATTAPKLPTAASGGSSPLVPLLERSRTEDTALALPPVPDEAAAKSAMLALRRAARILGCGVKVRTTRNDDGTVTVTFQHKTKPDAK